VLKNFINIFQRVKRGKTSLQQIGWVGGKLLKVFLLILNKEAGLITKQSFGTSSKNVENYSILIKNPYKGVGI